MNTYSVRKYFVVEVLVEAESMEEAKDFALDYEYTVDAQYARFAGGPEIQAADMDDEVIFIKGENDDLQP